MIALSKFILPGNIFLLTLATGVWLSRSGKPYSTGIFTIHKLISVAAVVLAAIQMVKALKISGGSALLIALAVIAILAVIALLATGALMSLDKLSYKWMLTIHQISPAVLAGAVAAFVDLLTKGQA